jgi:hypothetical protein
MGYAEETVDIFSPLPHGPGKAVELRGLRSNSLVQTMPHQEQPPTEPWMFARACAAAQRA